jgi:hypothetical protein
LDESAKIELEKLREEVSRLSGAAGEAKTRLEKAENDAKMAELEPLKELVEKAHGVLCRWNHTDGCSWGYEQDKGKQDWNGWAHERWLRHYSEIVNPSWGSNKPISVESINRILDLVIELKKIDDSVLWIIRNRLEP